MASSQPIVVAAGFIIYRRIQQQIQYLLLQTSYGEHHWTPPKGHVDPGESEIQTALRETEEEAGIKKEQMDIAEGFEKVLNYEVKGKPKKVIYWLSELKNADTPVTLSHEHQNYKWLTLTEALECAKYADMKEALQDAHSFISSS